ncbi:haloacid dehalogenase type II [Defluviimonas aestuarii]|uniref:haloacid dehalogenase type II n=1 Tax=Albidovulum aestuarii TaxID=1130726 RepID=UPI00249CA009|nr:haloacid dehalogenase type II [Defluviimonas aestuarii]MDI3337908.1 haloacid dehalogenase type II [Defluviimonas aestuarii]
MTITVCIFDAYGTLFDVAAAARQAATEKGREELAAIWPKLAEDWRRKQLEYTWLRAVMRQHTDFWTVTQDGLDWALEKAGLDDPDLRERLLALYWELEAYPEVPVMLGRLKEAGLQTAILSNGAPDMLEGAVRSAGIGELLDDTLSVESTGIFKPDASVYRLVTERFACTPDRVLFTSSNGWDAAAASGFGFLTAWVNRAGQPMDRLPARPQHVLSDLSTIPDIATQ